MTGHPFGTGWRFGPASAGSDRPDFDDSGFAEVRKRTAADPRVADLQAAIAEATADGADASPLRAKLASAWPAVHAEKLGQLADEFDRVHSIERAREVGSVQAIVPAARLRPYLIDAVRRGMQRTLAAGREGG